ncbi:MAG: hypothetical protein GY765_05655, partial [bacterium]|nr:hypothetical protein [bacterium]
LKGENTSDKFRIDDLGNLPLHHLQGDTLKLGDALDSDKPTYCFIFQLKDCASCIFKGLDDLVQLKKQGSSCIAIALHDYVEEVEGWSAHRDFSPFYVLKRADFYAQVHSMMLPVFVKFQDGKVKSFRFITP